MTKVLPRVHIYWDEYTPKNNHNIVSKIETEDIMTHLCNDTSFYCFEPELACIINKNDLVSPRYSMWHFQTCQVVSSVFLSAILFVHLQVLARVCQHYLEYFTLYSSQCTINFQAFWRRCCI